MNIRYGMNNFYVKYLKRFLNNVLSRSTSVLGDFQIEDQRALIKYLNLPNTSTIFEVQQSLLENFDRLTELFNISLSDEEIIFKSKVISEDVTTYLQDNIEDIRKLCTSLGWSVKDVFNWIDLNYDINSDGSIDELDRKILNSIIFNGARYDEDIMKKADINLDGFPTIDDLHLLDDYINNNKIYFIVKSERRKNYFPNKDMLVFVNQFEGDFIDNYAIRSTDGTTDLIHENANTKIGLYQCTPRSKSNYCT